MKVFYLTSGILLGVTILSLTVRDDNNASLPNPTAIAQVKATPLELKVPVVEPVVNVQGLIRKCDEQAADPDDRFKRAKPVSDDDMIAVVAREACEDAIKADAGDDHYRMQFQYGRSLRMLGQHDQAFEAIASAALGDPATGKNFVPIALKYVAEMYVEGFTPNGQDLQQAIFLYEQAIGHGVIAAEKPLANLKALIEHTTFDASKFNQRNFMNVLYTGDFSQLKKDDYYHFSIYLQQFISEFMKSDANSQDQDPYCKPLLDYYGAKFAEFNATMGKLNHLVSVVETTQINGLVNGLVSFISSELEAQNSSLKGNQDAWTLMTLYGCKDSDITKTIFANSMKSQEILVSQLSETVATFEAMTGYSLSR